MKFRGQEVVGFWSRCDGKIYCMKCFDLNNINDLSNFGLITVDKIGPDQNRFQCDECKKLIHFA